MRQQIKELAEIVSRTMPIHEPIFEFGSLQVPGQEIFANIRPYFKEKKYIGCDMQSGPGVDQVLDICDTRIASESVGTLLVLETLEHVEFCRKAVQEMHRIIIPQGILLISSTMYDPIHQYPYDFWRFSPDGFKSLLREFSFSLVDYLGEPKFPHTVIGIASKTNLPEKNLKDFGKNLKDWKEKWNRHDRTGFRYLARQITPPLITNSFRKIREFTRNK